MKNSWYLLFIILLFSTCKRYEVSFKEKSAWDSQWLLPLVHGTLRIEDIREICESGTVAYVSSMDLGFSSGVEVSIPPTTFDRLGPYALPTNEWIKSISMDSLSISISLLNVLPISINQGTSFIFRNSSDTTTQSNILYKYTLPKTIYPNEYFSVNMNIPVVTFINDSIYFSIENFSTQGGDSLLFSTNPFKCEVRLRAAAINLVEFYANKELNLTDTIALSIRPAEEIKAKEGDSVHVILKLENNLPLEQDVQLYFLNAVTGEIEDSLLKAPVRLKAGETSASGEPLSSYSQHVSIGLSRSRMEVLSSYQKGILYYRLSTKHSTKNIVAANKDCGLRFKFIGDFHLTYSFLR